MGRSTEYYRTHPEARQKKAKKDKEINKRPEQKARTKGEAEGVRAQELRHRQSQGKGVPKGQGLFPYDIWLKV